MEVNLLGTDMALVAMVLTLMTILKSLFEGFFKKRIVKRFLPVIPVIISVIISALGLMDNEMEMKSRLFIGTMSGITAAYLFKLGKTTVMGAGVDEGDKSKATK